MKGDSSKFGKIILTIFQQKHNRTFSTFQTLGKSPAKVSNPVPVPPKPPAAEAEAAKPKFSSNNSSSAESSSDDTSSEDSSSDDEDAKVKKVEVSISPNFFFLIRRHSVK